MLSKGETEFRISLKESAVVSFDFCRFFLSLLCSLLRKIARPKNKFGKKTVKGIISRFKTIAKILCYTMWKYQKRYSSDHYSIS